MDTNEYTKKHLVVQLPSDHYYVLPPEDVATIIGIIGKATILRTDWSGGKAKFMLLPVSDRAGMPTLAYVNSISDKLLQEFIATAKVLEDES